MLSHCLCTLNCYDISPPISTVLPISTVFWYYLTAYLHCVLILSHCISPLCCHVIPLPMYIVLSWYLTAYLYCVVMISHCLSPLCCDVIPLPISTVLYYYPTAYRHCVLVLSHCLSPMCCAVILLPISTAWWCYPTVYLNCVVMLSHCLSPLCCTVIPLPKGRCKTACLISLVHDFIILQLQHSWFLLSLIYLQSHTSQIVCHLFRNTSCLIP